MTSDIGKPQGESVMPPTVPIKGVNVPDPTTGSESERKDTAKDTEYEPDEAAEDGLA